MSDARLLNPFIGRKRDSLEELVDPSDRRVYDESTNAVPKGSAKEVLDWVGDDKARAQQAIEAERARADGGRKGLSRSLEHKLGRL